MTKIITFISIKLVLLKCVETFQKVLIDTLELFHHVVYWKSDVKLAPSQTMVAIASQLGAYHEHFDQWFVYGGCSSRLTTVTLVFGGFKVIAVYPIVLAQPSAMFSLIQNKPTLHFTPFGLRAVANFGRCWTVFTVSFWKCDNQTFLMI